MKNNKLNNFIQRLENVQLSETERAEVRASLEEHIEANQPVRSPWVAVLSPLQSIGRTAMVAAMVLLTVGGVTLAAENSLPGDPLYAVKVNVNEKVMSLTSLTSEDEAENQSRIAARRIAELEALAARGSLNKEVSNSLTQAISEHTQAARKHIEAVSAQGETGSAASLETELLSTLNTHSNILEDLAISNNGVRASTTAAAAQELRLMAQSKTESDVSTAVNNAQSLPVRANKGEELSSKQTHKLLERTANRLETARTVFANNYNTFNNSEARDGIENLLAISAETINQAVDSIQNEEYQAAATSLREALTYAHEATIIIQARHSLEQSAGVAIEQLLDNNSASSSAATSTESNITNQSQEVPDIKTPEPSEEDTRDTNRNRVQTAEEMANQEPDTASSSSASAASSTPTSTPPTATTTGTTSLNVDLPTSTPTSSGQNLTRYSASSSETYRKIDAVLQRVEEALSVSDVTPRAGLLPGRSSNATSSEDEVE